MLQNKKRKGLSIKNFSINTKMIGLTIGVLILVSLLAGYGLFEINNLSNKIHEIHDKNWPLANDVKEIRININDQMLDLHAYILGETDAKSAFTESTSLVQSYFNNISSLIGSNSDYTSAINYYSQLVTLASKKDTGLFDATDKYYSDSQILLQDYQNFLELHSSITNLILLLEAQSASETGHDNTTVSDELLTFNSILWDTQNLITKAYVSGNNDVVTSFKNDFLFNYNDNGNDESITSEIQRIDGFITGALVDGSIGSISTAYFNQIKNLILVGNATFNSWISYGNDQTNGIFTKLIQVNDYSVTKETALTQADSINENLSNSLTQLETLANNRMDSIVASSEISFLAMGILSIVIAIVTLSFGLLFARSISKPITEVADFSKILAQGDLTQKIKYDERADEIGVLYKSFSDMTAFLKNIILNITGLTQTLSASAEEMASSSEEVNASSEEISSISQQMSKGAQEQSRQISDSLNHSKYLRENFEGKVGEINTAAVLIESIASQVNMLALNASIEAARAGEYGRGFAVVADNIRKLADDSKLSVFKVQSTITDLRDSLSMSINIITSSIEKVASVAEETASGAEETSAATEEQAATMEELTASAQELSNVATKLDNVVKQFKV